MKYPAMTTRRASLARWTTYVACQWTVMPMATTPLWVIYELGWPRGWPWWGLCVLLSRHETCFPCRQYRSPTASTSICKVPFGETENDKPRYLHGKWSSWPGKSWSTSPICSYVHRMGVNWHFATLVCRPDATASVPRMALISNRCWWRGGKNTTMSSA
jgi:hypothetical protein